MPGGPGSAQAPSRPLRDHHLRRRAQGELRPDHAVAGAGGGEVLRRHRDQRRGLVRRPRHHAAHGSAGHLHRPAGQGGLVRGRLRRALRQADPGGRLRSDPTAVARRRPEGRGDFPRPGRRGGDDRRRDGRRPGRGDRRRAAGHRGGLRPVQAWDGGDGRPPDGRADGAPARCVGRLPADRGPGGQGRGDRAGGPVRGDPGGRTVGSPACA